MTSTIIEMSQCRSPLDICRPVLYAGRYADEMSNSRCSPSLRWISMGDSHPCWWSPADLFVASHWLERSSYWLAVTLLVFSRADHSTKLLTTSHVVIIPTFTEGLLQKSPYIHQTSSVCDVTRHG